MAKLILPDDLLPLGSFNLESQGDGLRSASEMRFAPSDLADDYVFFNHGVFFEAGFFEDETDPVGDWYTRFPEDVNVLKQAYGTPLFDGFSALTYDDRVNWGQVLCGVEKHAWPSLLEYLAGVAVRNWALKEFAWTYYGWVDILDPSYVDEKGVLTTMQTVRVCVFCMHTNKRTLQFARPLQISRRPHLELLPPRAEMVEIGKKALQDDFDPLVHRHNTAHADFLAAYRHALEHGPIVKD